MVGTPVPCGSYLCLNITHENAHPGKMRLMLGEDFALPRVFHASAQTAQQNSDTQQRTSATPNSNCANRTAQSCDPCSSPGLRLLKERCARVLLLTRYVLAIAQGAPAKLIGPRGQCQRQSPLPSEALRHLQVNVQQEFVDL